MTVAAAWAAAWIPSRVTDDAREVAVDKLLSAGFGAWRLDVDSPRLASSLALSSPSSVD
jgi:hypothetical protein